MKRDEIFKSKYLRHADLKGKPAVVTITSATLETLKNGDKEQEKIVLCFKGTPKQLPLNMVNWDSVAAIAGGDTDDWAGARIEFIRPRRRWAARSRRASEYARRRPSYRWQSQPHHRRPPPNSATISTIQFRFNGKRRSATSLLAGVPEQAMLRTALTLAKKGIHVFPCMVRSKAPACEHGFLDASTDATIIKDWWRHDPNFNIGIRTGTTSKLFAVDVDGLDAEAALAALEHENGDLPPTVEAITARGRHIYFQMPDTTIPCSSGKIAAGIDVKADGRLHAGAAHRCIRPASAIAGASTARANWHRRQYGC